MKRIISNLLVIGITSCVAVLLIGASLYFSRKGANYTFTSENPTKKLCRNSQLNVEIPIPQGWKCDSKTGSSESAYLKLTSDFFTLTFSDQERDLYCNKENEACKVEGFHRQERLYLETYTLNGVLGEIYGHLGYPGETASPWISVTYPNMPSYELMQGEKDQLQSILAQLVWQDGPSYIYKNQPLEEWTKKVSYARGISLSYPQGISYLDQSDKVWLFVNGKTQPTQQTILDGLAIKIYLKNTTEELATLASKDAEKTKQIMGLSTPLRPITLGAFSGYTYTTAEPEEIRYIYLEKANGDYLFIVDESKDPGNYGYQKVANEILDTLDLMQ